MQFRVASPRAPNGCRERSGRNVCAAIAHAVGQAARRGGSVGDAMTCFGPSFVACWREPGLEPSRGKSHTKATMITTAANSPAVASQARARVTTSNRCRARRRQRRSTVIGLVRTRAGDSSATRVRADGDVGGGSRLLAVAVSSGHRSTRRQQTDMNSRLNRMNWASVESARERRLLAAGEWLRAHRPSREAPRGRRRTSSMSCGKTASARPGATSTANRGASAFAPPRTRLGRLCGQPAARQRPCENHPQVEGSGPRARRRSPAVIDQAPRRRRLRRCCSRHQQRQFLAVAQCPHVSPVEATSSPIPISRHDCDGKTTRNVGCKLFVAAVPGCRRSRLIRRLGR